MASSEWSSKGGKDEETAAGGAMLLRESAVQLEPGAVLAGRFQIRRVLGKGATGVVLEADDRVSRSLVALKVFKPEIASDDRWQEILGSELRHARQLMHPNVCRVFDAGEADGYRFLSMEYASGGSLRQRLKEAGADRPFEERVADARAVVQGLAAIHAAGLIHRDVKPDNVLRMEDGRLVLTDFGLAVAPGQTTFVSGYSGAVGTPSYMAPEVALGGDASMASDVFSLGVILHEVFFGRRPDWETTKRGRFLRSPTDRNSSRRQRLMARVCSQCLEELAPRRPQTALEVGKRFERAALGGYGSLLGVFRAGKWGLVAGLVFAAAAAALVFFLTRPSDPTKHLKIVGKSTDLSQVGHVLTDLPARLRCLSRAPDGKHLRAVLGSPPQAIEISVHDGQTRSWNILPETYALSSCPAPSPDGQRVAFVVGTEMREIMLSPNPDGSAARKLADGFLPGWLPNGRELTYYFDNRRLAVITPGGSPALVPETGTTEQGLVDVSISPLGDRMALIYGDPALGQSVIAIHAIPSLALKERLRIPAWVRASAFSLSGRTLFLVAETEGRYQVLGLEPDGMLVRKVNLPGSDILTIYTDSLGLWLETRTRTASLLTAGSAATRGHEMAVAQDFTGMSSHNSHVVLEEVLLDGRSVIGVVDLKAQQYTRASDGPRDMGPLLHPDGETFAYIDWVRKRINLCPLRSPTECRRVNSDPSPLYLAGFSPSGKHLAYLSALGARYRLLVLSLNGGAIVDLGHGFSKRCPVRWSTETTLWAFIPSESPRWAEINLDRPNSSGRTEDIARLASDGCPAAGPEGEAGQPLQVSRRQELRLWRLPKDAAY